MKNIGVDEFKEKIDRNEKITIIDVRNPSELSRGKIPGSINIPLNSFESEVDEKVKDKDEEVFLYCLSGSRSAAAGQILESKGYKNVINLTHGLLGWRIKGYSLV